MTRNYGKPSTGRPHLTNSERMPGPSIPETVPQARTPGPSQTYTQPRRSPSVVAICLLLWQISLVQTCRLSLVWPTLPCQVCQRGRKHRKQCPALFSPLLSRNGWQGATHSTTNHQGLKQTKSHSLSNLMPYGV